MRFEANESRLLGLPSDVLALIYKSLTTLKDRQSFAQSSKAVRVPQVLQLINKTTISLQQSLDQPNWVFQLDLPELLRHPQGAPLTTLRVSGWGVGGWGAIAAKRLLEYASLEETGSQLQKMEREREKALLAGVKTLQLDNILVKPLEALFYLCPNLVTIVITSEQSLHFFLVIARAHLPCLRSMHINIVVQADLNLYVPGMNRICSEELRQALRDVDQKYDGVQCEISRIRVARNASVSILLASFQGTRLAKCVKAFDVRQAVLEADEREELVRIFLNAEVEDV